ncbi:hypothetical protein L9F63_014529, partial [Diploptera punctata]
ICDQMLLGETCSTFSPFCEKLCETFLSADIPLHKLNHPKLRTFLEEETGKLIPDPRTLRRTYVARLVFDHALRILWPDGIRNSNCTVPKNGACDVFSTCITPGRRR